MTFWFARKAIKALETPNLELVGTRSTDRFRIKVSAALDNQSDICTDQGICPQKLKNLCKHKVIMNCCTGHTCNMFFPLLFSTSQIYLNCVKTYEKIYSRLVSGWSPGGQMVMRHSSMVTSSTQVHPTGCTLKYLYLHHFQLAGRFPSYKVHLLLSCAALSFWHRASR